MSWSLSVSRILSQYQLIFDPISLSGSIFVGSKEVIEILSRIEAMILKIAQLHYKYIELMTFDSYLN